MTATPSDDRPDSSPRSGAAGPPPWRLSVATFNVHAGVDGYGRSFDLVEACKGLDADILVLQEVWGDFAGGTPGQAPAGTTQADEIASALGYRAYQVVLATGRRLPPAATSSARWTPAPGWRRGGHALYFDGPRPVGRRRAKGASYRRAAPGSWVLAVLARVPVRSAKVVDLGQMGRDPARRAAVVLEVPAGDRVLQVVGTHMSHLSQGSPWQYGRLRRELAGALSPGPALVAGDMNLWGPPVSLLLPGWRRAVRGRTWPAWRPHSQVDHILVRGALDVLGGAVAAPAGSDHRPVRAILAWRSPAPGEP